MRSFFSFIVASAMLLCSMNIAFAMDFNKFSDDYKIVQALHVIEDTNNTSAINLLERNKNKLLIKFYDLSMISFSFHAHYALRTSANDGYEYILINTKYQNTSKEALSSLIAHELTHELRVTTFEEEVRAWTNEALQWIRCKKHNPNLAKTNENDLLAKRLNRLERLYKQSKDSRLLAQEIRSISVYDKLALQQ